MATTAAVFGIAARKQAAVHHLLDVCLSTIIYQLGIKKLELFPVVTKYLDKAVFVVNGLVIKHG
jgi:hypothetical protein